jgi:hypothetical protein
MTFALGMNWWALGCAQLRVNTQPHWAAEGIQSVVSSRVLGGNPVGGGEA